MSEPMTLIERLRNPAWEHEPNTTPRLNTDQTVKTMQEAADALEQSAPR